MRVAWLVSAALACALGALVQAPALGQKAAPDPLALVDARYDRTAAVARAIWDFAELGYRENRSSALLQAELAREGFKVTKGSATYDGNNLLAMEPDYYMGNLLLGAVYARLGRYKEALERYQKLIGLFGREPLILDHQARLFGLWGKREEARKLVEELELVANERHVGPAHFVWTSVALGERQKALEHLTRAWEEKDPLLPFVLIWPWPQIAELEGEREVREIRRRMGLED